jgi:hypothetical protein
MEKIIPIVSNKDKFFRQYVELMNPIFKLNGRELDVLSEIIKMNDSLVSVDEKFRGKLLLDYDSKRIMCDNLKMSDASFNNNLTSLRKKGLLLGNNLAKGISVYLGNSLEFKVIYSFKLPEDVK